MGDTQINVSRKQLKGAQNVTSNIGGGKRFLE
jgi:hypothetical protein